MALKSIKKNMLWALFFLSLAAASIAALAGLINIHSDEKNALIFGFSIQRLVLIAAVLIPLLTALYGSARAALRPLWVENRLEPALKRLAGTRLFVVISATLVLTGWLALFIPPYWFGYFHAYYVRLRPIIIWLGFCSALALSVFMVWIKGWRPGLAVRSMRGQGGLLLTSMVIVAFLCAFWLFVALTGLGIKADPYFWNEAGVPLLGLQLILSLLLVAVASRLVFSRDPANRRRAMDWGVVILVWLIAFILWLFTTMPRSYFAPGPYPPNNIFYPYSDAEHYDYSAQYLLLGQGISNGNFFDKPAYAFILALLHLIAGQNYILLVSLQVALLALVPVGLYLLGKNFHSRQLGLLVALMAIFQQRNAIAATLEIQVSHSKLLLSEYPTALGLIFFCLFMVRWFQMPEKRPSLLLVGGGALGLTSLIRPNALLLAPVMVLLILIHYRRRFKRGLLVSTLFMLVFGLTILPWNLVIPKGFQAPYLIVKAKALFDTRYRLLEFKSSNIDSPNDTFSIPVKKALKLAAPAKIIAPDHYVDEENEESSYTFIFQHFFHNEIMAFFILPHSISLNDLDNTLQTPYWQDILNWRGELPANSSILIFFNIALLSIGIGAAWKRWRAAGLIPLIIQISYYFANGVVRNSGARYLVPVDWVMLVYFGLGIIQVFHWLGCMIGVESAAGTAEPEATLEAAVGQAAPLRWQRSVMIGAIFLALGGLLPLSKFAFPKQLPEKNPAEILLELKNIEWNDETVVDWLDSLETNRSFEQPEVAVVMGRGLYPRFYEVGQGESNGELALSRLPASSDSRFTMRILAYDFTYLAILPMPHSPTEIPDGVTTVVIGCHYGREKHIDAAAILILSDVGEVYWRSSDVELSCRLPLP